MLLSPSVRHYQALIPLPSPSSSLLAVVNDDSSLSASDVMHAKNINQADGKRFSRSEGGFPARKSCVLPFPTVVERIRLYIEDRVNHLRVRAAWVAIPEKFLGRENTRATFLDSPETRPRFVAVTVKQ